MTAAQALTAPRRREWRLPVVLGIAVRELRSGISGFGIFIACVALGVTVITGVGAVSDALRGGFEAQGEAILGGDATLARMHVRSQGPERAVLDGLGRISESSTMRTMESIMPCSATSVRCSEPSVAACARRDCSTRQAPSASSSSAC